MGAIRQNDVSFGRKEIKGYARCLWGLAVEGLVALVLERRQTSYGLQCLTKGVRKK